MTVEWGTLGQWAGPMVAIAIALFAAFSKTGEKAIEALRKAIEEDIVELKNNRTELFARMNGAERDMAGLKSDVRHLASKQDVHVIENKVTALAGKVDGMDDKLDLLIEQNRRAEDRAIAAEKE